MKVKNLPDDNNSKSLEELTQEVNRTIEQLEQEIIDIISIPVCSDDSNCKFIGFGAKPCGGYWEYLVYSIANVDSTILINKVIQYNELNDSLNIQYGISSDCELLFPPNVHCDNGICVGN